MSARSGLFFLASVLALAVLSGCTHRAPLAGTASRHSITPLLSGDRDLIVITALAQVGKPYRFGGNGPEAFDCSGLVRHAYRTGGADTPRTTAELFRRGQVIELAKAQPADLLFYRLDAGRDAPSHVVFYLGNSEGIHAPSSGGQIRAVRIDTPYFSQRFAGARRLLQ